MSSKPTSRAVEEAPLLGPAGFAQSEAELMEGDGDVPAPQASLSREERNKRLEEQLRQRQSKKKAAPASQTVQAESQAAEGVTPSLTLESFLSTSQAAAPASTDGTAAEGDSQPSGPRINPITGEVNGPKGPEPTRYGDYERSGRCFDF